MKKAFTLVELLAVIILLGLLGLIIYPTVNGVIKNNKNKLHDKQIKELIRLGNTYAASNANKLRYDGIKNILTFNDLYEAGLIQTNTVIDPKTDLELTGCLSLTFNEKRNVFDIEYTNDCNPLFKVSGTIIPSYSFSRFGITEEIKVKLLRGNTLVYETKVDSNNEYEFINVEGGTYLLLVESLHNTKYGMGIVIDKDVSKDIEAKFYIGDFNNDNSINRLDINDLLYGGCFSKRVNSNPECFKYDINNNDLVDSTDMVLLLRNENFDKIGEVIIDGVTNITGKITNFGTVSPTITLSNNVTSYTTTLNSDNTFNFDNIPKGSYRLKIEKAGYLTYDNSIILQDSMNFNVSMIVGDVDGNYIIDEDDADITESKFGNVTDNSRECDLNEDGVVNFDDLSIVNSNIGKNYSY